MRRRNLVYGLIALLCVGLVVGIMAWPRQSSMSGGTTSESSQLSGEASDTVVTDHGAPYVWQRTWQQSLATQPGYEQHTTVYVDKLLLDVVVWMIFTSLIGLGLGLGERYAHSRH